MTFSYLIITLFAVWFICGRACSVSFHSLFSHLDAVIDSIKYVAQVPRCVIKNQSPVNYFLCCCVVWQKLINSTKMAISLLSTAINRKHGQCNTAYVLKHRLNPFTTITWLRTSHMQFAIAFLCKQIIVSHYIFFFKLHARAENNWTVSCEKEPSKLLKYHIWAPYKITCT